MAAVIKELGAWPTIIVLALFMLAPWLVMLWVSRSMEKKHAEAVKMYENNVLLVQDHADLVKAHAALVEDYDAATKRWERITDTVISVVTLNTQAQTKLLDSIRSNDFCPAVREGRPNRG